MFFYAVVENGFQRRVGWQTLDCPVASASVFRVENKHDVSTCEEFSCLICSCWRRSSWNARGDQEVSHGARGKGIALGAAEADCMRVLVIRNSAAKWAKA